MSAVDNILSQEVERLTIENSALVHQNKRLAQLLADSLGILDRFKRDAEDTLRHYGCQRTKAGKFDWKELLDR